MSRSSLYLDSLDVNRMPGFPPTRAFGIDQFSPGVNIIYGPNESGKTTVAQAIDYTLHGPPRRMREAILRAHVRTSDSSYDVRIEAGQRTFLKNGDPDPGPALPTRSVAHRYKLWLHELLQAENANRDFAQHIMQESTGGYDIRRARDNLRFRSSPSPSGIGERRDYTAASSKLREMIEKEVVDPRHTERRLRDLKQEREEAGRADFLGRALERALTYREHRAGMELADRRVKELPEALADMTGHEPEELKKLRTRRQEAHRAVRDAEGKINAAQTSLRDADLPNEDPPEGLTSTLRQYIQNLKGMEGDIETLEREVRKSQSKEEAARRALGAVTDLTVLKGVDTALLERADRLAERAEGLRQKQAVLDAVDRWLDGEQPSVDTDNLKEGIRVLRRWLQVSEAPAATISRARVFSLLGGASTALAGLSGILLSVGGLAPIIVGIGGIAFLIAGLVLLMLSWQPAPTGDVPDARKLAERDFGRTRLEPPPTWEREPIEGHLSRLEDGLVDLKLTKEREREREKLVPDREVIDMEVEELEEEAKLIAEDLGVRLDLGGRSFLWFVRNAATWQVVRTDLAGEEGKIAAAQTQRDSLIEKIAQKLAPYGYDEPTGAESALSQVELLEKRFQTFRSAKRDLIREQSIHDGAKRNVRSANEEIQELFERLKLRPDDDAGLQQLDGLREEYHDALRERSRSGPLRDRALDDLREEPGYDERMEELGTTEIRAELNELQDKRSRLEQLGDEIPRLEQKIQDAKQEHKVEAAIGARDVAVSKLRDKMEKEAEQIIGWTVAEYIHEQTKDHDRPVVFHRARELFATITRGRYLLQLSDSEPPEFRAQDTQHNEVKPLDHLSSGTRVQLLLSVRLAFVEQQERGPMLPLILDETLANTDDIRALAIINAVIKIATEGRQIFYLTAQDDEVRKWTAVLENGEEGNPPHQFIDLAKTRSLSEELAAPTVDLAPSPFKEIPEPEGMDHQTYGHALSVPRFNPVAGLGDAHIWYVIEDPDLVHTLLQLGIERWGQLQTLWQEIGDLRAILPEDQWMKIRARAAALSAYGSASSVGRGKPVDRVVLQEADGVSPKKIDDIAELAERLAGDGAELLKALARKGVPHFRESQYEKLEEFLVKERFVDNRAPLSHEDITQRTLASVAQEIEDGILGPNDVLELLERATKGPSP